MCIAHILISAGLANRKCLAKWLLEQSKKSRTILKQTKQKISQSKPRFAKKSLGQNFLSDQNYIGKIISALNPQPDETIIEIGPGRGALTQHLVESGANVIAIELDTDLIPLLQKEFKDYDNFQIIEQDALKVDFSTIRNPQSAIRIKLVANLPYYISTAILQRLIEQREVFSEMVLMLQREVVERITAQAGKSERGFLTVLVEAFCVAEKLFDVPPTAFRPAPKVWSSVVSIRPKIEVEISNDELFRQIISTAFRQKRKTLQNNLKNMPDFQYLDVAELLEKVNINPNHRAESLTIEEWINLINEYERIR
jgi:16S rRNA (adenine1518-N6/adenine1519-N6)-dimethyltransferase